MTGIQTEPKPHCPECGAQMTLRRPRPGQAWEPFWGCFQYPDCQGKRNVGADGKPETDEGRFTPHDLEDL